MVNHLAEAFIEVIKAQTAVTRLELAKHEIDRDLKAAKLRLREAEDDLTHARQLRIF